jgi:hypothetical protein
MLEGTWFINKDFVRKGRSEKVQFKRKKQTIVCHCEGIPNVISKRPSKRPSRSCINRK